MRQFISRYIEDLLILVGLLVIAVATFRLNLTAGLYVVGVELLGVGVMLARHPPRGR